jgi:hypothetical protein
MPASGEFGDYDRKGGGQDEGQEPPPDER